MNYNKPIKAENTAKNAPQVSESEELKTDQLMATVSCPSKLNVRKYPDILSPVIITVSDGEDLLVYNSILQDEWVRIHTSSGIEGYVVKEYLGPTWVK